MRYRVLVLIAAVVVSACAGSPSPTSPGGPTPSNSFLVGKWSGNLTITPSGQAAISGPTTWTFATLPNMPTQSLRLTIESSNPWLPIPATSNAVVTPADPPANVGGTGTY